MTRTRRKPRNKSTWKLNCLRVNFVKFDRVMMPVASRQKIVVVNFRVLSMKCHSSINLEDFRLIIVGE